MPSEARGAAHGEEGTASVELVAVVPFLLLAILVAAQIALAGQALWSASVAARAGARAALVGGDHSRRTSANHVGKRAGSGGRRTYDFARWSAHSRECHPSVAPSATARRVSPRPLGSRAGYD